MCSYRAGASDARDGFKECWAELADVQPHLLVLCYVSGIGGGGGPVANDLIQRGKVNRRDNDLETGGWNLLRFNSYQLREQMEDYCLPTIVKNLKDLGGTDPSRVLPRDIQLDPSAPSQMSLFDDQS